MYQITTQRGILFNNNMELPSTEGPSTWEAAGENIPDGMYTMTEFDEHDMEDGKPVVKNPPNDTAETTTPSP